MKRLALLVLTCILASCGGGSSQVTSLGLPTPAKFASTVNGDTEIVLHLYQALYGKAPSNVLLTTFKSQIAANGATAWANSLAAQMDSLSTAVFCSLVLNNLSVSPNTLVATTQFGTGQQAYDALLASFIQYMGLAGSANRGVVAAQLASIFSKLEVDTQFGVYSNAALALNKQITANNAYSTNPANLVDAVVPEAVAISPLGNSWRYRQRIGGAVGMVNIAGVLHQYGLNQSTGWLTSSDNGNTWQERRASLVPELITSIGGRLVAVGSYFQYASSADGGATWTSPKRLPGLDPKYDNVSNAPGCFVTVGAKLFAKSFISDSTPPEVPIWVSTDGGTFQVATSAEVDALNAALIGYTGTSRACKGVLPNNARSLLSNDFGGQNNVPDDPGAIGSRYFSSTLDRNSNVRSWLVSSDKQSWTTLPVSGNWAPYYVAEVSPGRFLAIGDTRYPNEPLKGTRDTYLSTNNGVSWTNVGGGPNIGREFTGISAKGLNSIAVASDGWIARSLDSGATWVDTQVSTASLNAITVGNNVFVAVGDNGTLLSSSDDGATWTKGTGGGKENFQAVSFGNGKFLAVASSSAVFTSVDGAAWVSTGLGVIERVADGFFGGALAPTMALAQSANNYVLTVTPSACVGSNCTSAGRTGTFYSNDGGATWNKASVPNASGVAYGNGLFLVSGSGNIVNRAWISADLGKTWTARGQLPTGYYGVNYGNGIFSLNGNNGVSASLDGGVTWTTYSEPAGNGLKLTYSGGMWLGYGWLNQLVTIGP